MYPRHELNNATHKSDGFPVDKLYMLTIITVYRIIVCEKNTISDFGICLPKNCQRLVESVLSAVSIEMTAVNVS